VLAIWRCVAQVDQHALAEVLLGVGRHVGGRDMLRVQLSLRLAHRVDHRRPWNTRHAPVGTRPAVDHTALQECGAVLPIR